MSARTVVRIALVVAVAGGVFGLVWFAPDVRPPGTVGTILDGWPDGADPQTCARCHAAIVAEWQADAHARAYTNPERNAMELQGKFTKLDCDSCHAPAPIFEAGLGLTPPRRTARPESGVDCVACHLTADGMASADPRFRDARPDPVAAPCRPVYRPALAEVGHCQTCHDQHQTVGQWRATRFARPGPEARDCLACHAPAADGPATLAPGATAAAGATHRSHRMAGAHDLAFVRGAVRLVARRTDGGVRVEIDTRATGHNFPTDYRTRFGLLLVEGLDASGAMVATLLHEKFRQPFRSEPGGSTPEGNTQLRGDAVHGYDVPLGGHVGPVRVRLYYSLRPYNDGGPDVSRRDDFTSDALAYDRMALLHEERLP